MAELTFKSPGVGTREIDLSSPTPVTPQGTPAAVIGTATRGPAFVPVTFASYRDFAARHGETDGEQFGPLAIQQWLANRQSGLYIRVLGAGNSQRRVGSGTNAGKVTNAGFVVGDRQVQASGLVGANTHAYSGGPLGRTHFLGCFMSETNGSDVFTSAGLISNRAHPIIRGILFAASGVVPMLSSSAVADNTPAVVAATSQPKATSAANTSQGANIGTINKTSQEFVLLLNGLKQTSLEGPNVITASFDPQSPSYFLNVFNTDPTEIETAGYFLYRHYDVYSADAVVTASGISTGHSTLEQSAFILTGSQAHNLGTTTLPNFEGFEDRFRTAFSPWVISQKFGGSPQNLFRVHSLDDGEYPNSKVKISIENISKSPSSFDAYGKFDLVVRDFSDDDRNKRVIEQFRGLSLDPSSDNYIARVIGDMRTYYDFDQRPGSQKLVVEGKFPSSSRHIRIEMAAAVDDAEIDVTALPVGFRGINHLVTSGTSAAGATSLALTSSVSPAGVTLVSSSFIAGAVEPPLPLRRSVRVGTNTSARADWQLYWGVQFEPVDIITEPNKNNSPAIERSPVEAFTKYFGNYHTTFRNPWVGGNEGTPNDGSIVLDADEFNNNGFSLENIQIVTSSTDIVDANEWQAATYRRDGTLAVSLTKRDGTTQAGRFLSPAKDFGDVASKTYLKFTFPLQGGFDGVNIFDEQKARLTDTAVKNELGDAVAAQGPTVSAYTKALGILQEKSDVDIQLLVIPGIRQPTIANAAIAAVESRFDALYIMDIPVYDSQNTEITDFTLSTPSVAYTAAAFGSRALDSSFAAAYFPDVYITDPTTGESVLSPPSVAVLGAFGLNDAVAHPWYAPAGFSRGALSATEVAVKTNRDNLDTLYDARINPITSFPGQASGGPVIFGQKTLQATESALDRVNVRRLLIEIRRQVRAVANRFIFEPNREATLARFSGEVNPILTRIQQQQGLDRFKVQIDTTTTTQADVENNTVRGKIFLQPTKSVEFISLDFVVTNAGAQI